MKIAKEAGIPNGSLFTYFETKAELFNQLYLELKTEVALAAMEDVRAEEGSREYFFKVWQNWTNWAVRYPERRKALVQLNVSDDITPAPRAAAHRAMKPVADVMDRSRAAGPLSKAPFAFVAMLMNSVAEGTMEYMMQDPKHARKHCAAGFDAVWRMIA